MSESIGVIGAGTMGNGIAQTAASAGFDVVMCDVKQEFVDRGVANISKSLDRFVKKETMTEGQKNEVLGRFPDSAAAEDMGNRYSRRKGSCPYRQRRTIGRRLLGLSRSGR